MGIMNRIALGAVALLIPLAVVARADAAPVALIGGSPHAPDACKSPWVKSLGDVPCETREDPAALRCDLGKPVYTSHNRFRVYVDGAWTPWWMYYTTYRPAPRTAC